MKLLATPRSIALAATLALGGIIATAVASPTGAGGPGLGGGRMQQIMTALNVTPAQKDQLVAVVKTHQSTIEPLVRRLVQQRRELRDTVRNQSLDETAIRTANSSLSSTQADLAVAIGKLVNDVKPLLTQEQQAKIEQFRANHQDRMDNFLERVFEHIKTL